MSKFETRMANIRTQHASIVDRMRPLKEQLAALQAEARELSKAAWMAHDVEFVTLVKAQMLTGEVRCVRRAYSTLAIFDGPGEDRDYPEQVGIVRAVHATGRKHVGVWVWFPGQGADTPRSWRWVRASDCRSGHTYVMTCAGANEPIRYPAMPKELRG